ncbi:hypothetical protein [Nonomuraea typhae]|uniref:hypothetical protein n=1 Tax=Nonomuraea typhae TaxID=2603600 RepID=UPI0012F9DBAE|nr:hypothetical protein [Nonomuraea typhae]
MRRTTLATAALLLSGCTAATGGTLSTTPTTAAAVREPPGQRICAGANQQDFDPGLGSRIVTSGPAALLAFVLAQRPSPTATVRSFKLAVRAEPGADFTVTTGTSGTALLFDRARYRADNTYTLADGAPSYRFTGCPDRRALWVGSILTTGPATVSLTIRYGAAVREITVTAYERR